MTLSRQKISRRLTANKLRLLQVPLRGFFLVPFWLREWSRENKPKREVKSVNIVQKLRSFFNGIAFQDGLFNVNQNKIKADGLQRHGCGCITNIDANGRVVFKKICVQHKESGAGIEWVAVEAKSHA